MIAFCTVITMDYMDQAAVLFQSLAKHQQDYQGFALVIDADSVSDLPADLPYTVVLLEELDIHNLDQMVIYYNAFELCNAVRPSWIKHLMLHYNSSKVIYLDSDIYVTSSFDEALSLLDTCLFSFTPHITKPLPLDGQQPDDLQLLQVGLYNSGFWMFRQHERSLEMLDWLISRFEIYCFDDLSRRMFCDQKLLPMLVHHYAEDFRRLDAPQYNIAHWNMFQRELYREDGRYWVDGKPVVFVHLSGFKPDQPEVLTHHLHRMSPELLEVIQPLLQEYASLLTRAAAVLQEKSVPELRSSKRLVRSPIPEVTREYKYLREPRTGWILTDFRRKYYFQHRSLEGVKRLERRAWLKKAIKRGLTGWIIRR
ncbi:hypothetical protein JJQ72_11315 [Paenibacillus sp. F411]|uniref:hypothetical protein n=1 Tax=Paenibacillus sp. F411 TaxID=2820239 RepID=UPI001AB0180E|nr:hypothetical protein [Paenibacillus sp. F411]MBO2944558.1 hypothetical protein [Paenibacillus sp. F411]